MRSSRRGGTAPTISDVASAAGVSPMTVSRVINRDGNVRRETLDRVNAAIKSLNYLPNSAARLLAGARQTRIALLYGNPSKAYLSEVLLGSLAEAARSDVQIVLEECESLTAAIDVARRVVFERLDGVILPAPFSDAEQVISILLKAKLPVAALSTGASVDGAYTATIDNTKAAFDMTRHLIALGHRQIAFIIGNRNQTDSARRLEGYKQALRQAELPVEAKLVAQGDFSYRSGLKAATRLLESSPRPTAIFASNDDMAAATIAAAHRKHLEVPKDLSVCGFDDTALATTISPELTTVRQPVVEMAQAAVGMLVAAIRRHRMGKPAPTEQRIFRHEIIRRQSDAALQRRSRA